MWNGQSAHTFALLMADSLRMLSILLTAAHGGRVHVADDNTYLDLTCRR